MTREQRKEIVELVGFGVLILSLVFVGLETRNSAIQTELNTQAVRIAAYQELITNISNQNTISMQDDSAAAVIARMRGVADPESEAIDRVRLTAALYNQFRHGDMAFFMFEQGVINETRLKSTLRPIPLNNEIGIRFWNRNKEVFVVSYQQYVDALIEQGFWK